MRFFVYTPKAARILKGKPGSSAYPDRLLIAEGPNDGRKRLQAWKFDVDKQGLTGPLDYSFTPERLCPAYMELYFKLAREKGSEPTATVMLDSHHKELTLTQAIAWVNKQMSRAGRG